MPRARCNVGDPDLDTTAKALLALDAAGCDIIELGIPYSDPLADGPTIQSAADRALNKGCKLQDVIEMLAGCSSQISVRIYPLTSGFVCKAKSNYLEVLRYLKHDAFYS